MGRFNAYLRKHPLSILLLAFPLAIIARASAWSPTLVFLFAAVGVIPMAGYIGEATEALAEHTGPKIGGLLNATLGNAAELIITLVAIRAGLLDLVKASITGSILGNLLLVMGASMVFGGLRHGIQNFDRRQSGNHSILLILSVLALVIPSFYSLRSTSAKAAPPLSYGPVKTVAKGAWSIRTAVIVLALATLGVVVLSELLVGAVESVVSGVGLSEFFMGIILIPIIGNVAEHLVAVQAANRNDMELSVEIAISSSLQIALFVAPLLVFISLLMGHPLTLVFNAFELSALGAGVLVAALVSIDGESNWLEGASLLSVYIILGIAFFLLPAG
jgi:Ca2+:H+ antiporter